MPARTQRTVVGRSATFNGMESEAFSRMYRAPTAKQGNKAARGLFSDGSHGLPARTIEGDKPVPDFPRGFTVPASCRHR
jgi:hypothetical protein